MSQSESSQVQAALIPIKEALADIVEARYRREHLPKPTTASEWIAWLINETFTQVRLGALMGDATSFDRAATLFEMVAVLAELGVHRAQTIPAFPAYLSTSDPSTGVQHAIVINQERARHALTSLIKPLRRQYALDQFIQERCEQERLPFPANASQWLSMLINDGCLLAHSLSQSLLDEAAPLANGTAILSSSVHLQRQRVANAGSDRFLFQLVSDEFRCVAALYQEDIRPARNIPIFPSLRV